MSAHDPDLIRRIELERADAADKALEKVIHEIQNHQAKGEYYRKMLKTLERIVMKVRAKY